MRLLVARVEVAPYPSTVGTVGPTRASIPLGGDGKYMLALELLDVVAAFEVEVPV